MSFRLYSFNIEIMHTHDEVYLFSKSLWCAYAPIGFSQSSVRLLALLKYGFPLRNVLIWSIAKCSHKILYELIKIASVSHWFICFSLLFFATDCHIYSQFVCVGAGYFVPHMRTWSFGMPKKNQNSTF